MTQSEAERRAEERRKALEKYFKEAPDPRDLVVAHVVMVAGSAGCALAAGLFVSVMPVLGSVVLWSAATVAVMGCVQRFHYAKARDAAEPRPTDREMDQLFASELATIAHTALVRLGLTLDDLALTSGEWDPIAQLERGNPILSSADPRPLLVFGPGETAMTAIGRDAVWRFSAYRVMVICPTHYNLGLYTCAIDLLTGALSREETHEYHYDDVVAVSTVTTADDDAHPGDPRADREFRFARTLLRQLRIIISSGDRRSITVGVAGHMEAGRAAVQSSGIEEVIAAVRRVLREKKGTRELEAQ
jgi:hypothetical protein